MMTATRRCSSLGGLAFDSLPSTSQARRATASTRPASRDMPPSIASPRSTAVRSSRQGITPTIRPRRSSWPCAGAEALRRFWASAARARRRRMGLPLSGRRLLFRLTGPATFAVALDTRRVLMRRTVTRRGHEPECGPRSSRRSVEWCRTSAACWRRPRLGSTHDSGSYLPTSERTSDSRASRPEASMTE